MQQAMCRCTSTPSDDDIPLAIRGYAFLFHGGFTRLMDNPRGRRRTPNRCLGHGSRWWQRPANDDGAVAGAVPRLVAGWSMNSILRR